jgi:hypothetical protein
MRNEAYNTVRFSGHGLQAKSYFEVLLFLAAP